MSMNKELELQRTISIVETEEVKAMKRGRIGE
jgi:hypothetical protein